MNTLDIVPDLNSAEKYFTSHSPPRAQGLLYRIQWKITRIFHFKSRFLDYTLYRILEVTVAFNGSDKKKWMCVTEGNDEIPSKKKFNRKHHFVIFPGTNIKRCVFTTMHVLEVTVVPSSTFSMRSISHFGELSPESWMKKRCDVLPCFISSAT